MSNDIIREVKMFDDSKVNLLYDNDKILNIAKIL